MVQPVPPLPDSTGVKLERKESLRERRLRLQGSPRHKGPTGKAALEQLLHARTSRTHALRDIRKRSMGGSPAIKEARERQRQKALAAAEIIEQAEEGSLEEDKPVANGTDDEDTGASTEGLTSSDIRVKITYNERDKSLKSALRKTERSWSASKSLPSGFRPSRQRDEPRRRSLTFSPRCQIKADDGEVSYGRVNLPVDDAEAMNIIRRPQARTRPRKKLDLSDLVASSDEENSSATEPDTSSSTDSESEVAPFELSDSDRDLGVRITRPSPKKTEAGSQVSETTRATGSEDTSNVKDSQTHPGTEHPTEDAKEAESESEPEPLQNLSERLDCVARDMSVVVKRIDSLASLVQQQQRQPKYDAERSVVSPLSPHVADHDGRTPHTPSTALTVHGRGDVASEAMRFVAVTVVTALYLVVFALLLREIGVDIRALLSL
ncbi:MAG: hypothetical protein MHM6MM_005133 [Cercozoa sp. M6MM]